MDSDGCGGNYKECEGKSGGETKRKPYIRRPKYQGKTRTRRAREEGERSRRGEWNCSEIERRITKSAVGLESEQWEIKRQEVAKRYNQVNGWDRT